MFRVLFIVVLITISSCASQGWISYKSDEDGTWVWSDKGTFYVILWDIEFDTNIQPLLPIFLRRAATLCASQDFKTAHIGANKQTSTNTMPAGNNIYVPVSQESRFYRGLVQCANNEKHIGEFPEAYRPQEPSKI